jgi:hypothetical protein
MFYSVCEESIVMTPPDLLGRSMRRAALSVAEPFVFGARIGGFGQAVIRSRTKIPRLGTGFGVSKTLGSTTSAVSFTSWGHEGASPRQSRPSSPKKIQPPVSAGYEGLLFPPEQSEKIFLV